MGKNLPVDFDIQGTIMSQNKIRVLHPITRLIVGGAQENTLFTAQGLNKNRYHVDVVSGPQTGPEGSLIQTAQEMGVHLEILPELVREIYPWKDFITVFKLYRLMRDGKYKIVQN